MNDQYIIDTTTGKTIINQVPRDIFNELSANGQIDPRQVWFITDKGYVAVDCDKTYDDEVSSLQHDLNALSTEVSTLSEWTTSQIDDLTGDVQEVSSQTAQNAQDIADISANLTHSTVRRWEYVEYNGLTFTAEEANSTVAMQKVGSAPDVSLEYSTGDGWNDFIVGTTTVTLPNIGDQVVIRAKTTNNGFSTANSVFNNFVMTGKIAASDSIMYLLKNDGDLDTIPSDFCFNGMFMGCTSLTQAPELPATTLKTSCYRYLFNGCTSLTQAPELSATTMVNRCCDGMFQNCSSLTTAPDLPATTLGTRCYQSMFVGCSSLTTPPELPATTLATGCYAAMFTGCISLTTAPDLPATTLTSSCYQGMFDGCTSLTTAPELPATTLADQCYYGMFYRCTSLTTAPYLPATTLADNCYNTMFSGCTSLTQSPDLPATTLASNCYRSMFENCSSLNSIKIAYTGNFNTTAFENWVAGVASTGTFYYDGEDTTTGNSAIPTGWEVRGNTLPLTFTAEEANSIVSMQAVGSAPSVSLEYSTDGSTWNDFILGTTTVTLANVGDKMFLRAKTTNSGFASSNTTYNWFVMSGKIAASGSIMYLLKKDGDLDTIPSDFCFNSLFMGCSSLTTAPDLPATTLANLCYANMFRSCSSLTTAPVLPATTLATGCYQNMFYGCSSLTTPPELPATTLANYCYSSMFKACALTTAPELPATTLAQYCYQSMFENCTSLTTAPELPATTLTSSCYSNMFRSCSSLTTVPDIAATTLASRCYDYMFYYCTSLNSIKIGYTGTFSEAPALAFRNWVSNVASTGTFYYNGSDTSNFGTSAIPTNWTVQSF